MELITVLIIQAISISDPKRIDELAEIVNICSLQSMCCVVSDASYVMFRIRKRETWTMAKIPFNFSIDRNVSTDDLIE